MSASTATAIRQALFTGIRTGRTLAMARPTITLIGNAQQRRTFIPVFVPIYGWGSRTPPKPKKTEEDYEQEFDFRLNPLFQCNPTGVNDQVNSGASTGTSQVPYKVRMLINGLASTDRNIYKLTDPTLLPCDRQTIIKQYELTTFTREEMAQVRIIMDQIGNQTEREYRQVSKLVHNKDTLIHSADSDKVQTAIMSAIGTVLYGWLAYKGFIDNRYEPYATFTRAITDVLHLHYWFWLAPAVGWLVTADTSKRQKQLTELYWTYTKENYLTKYQYKLTQMNDLRKLFENTNKFMTDANNSAGCT
jgi:hypothetical protein